MRQIKCHVFAVCYVSTNVCLTWAGKFLLSLELDMTSAHLIRKVVTAANKAREHAMRRSSNIDEEGIASAIRSLRERWTGLRG